MRNPPRRHQPIRTILRPRSRKRASWNGCAVSSNRCLVRSSGQMTAIDAETRHAIPSNAALKDSDVVIAPCGFVIQKPKMSNGSRSVDTNQVDDILPEVREGLNLLPPLPTVVIELLKEIQNTSSTASSVAEIAASDPSLAAQILRTVNRCIRIPRKVTDVTHAVALLGFGIVRSMVVQLRLERILPQRSPLAAVEAEDPGLIRWRFLISPRALADRVRDVDRGLVATLGLLHDIGRLAIVSQFPDRAASLAACGPANSNRLEREARAFPRITPPSEPCWATGGNFLRISPRRSAGTTSRAACLKQPIRWSSARPSTWYTSRISWRNTFSPIRPTWKFIHRPKGAFELLGLQGTINDLLDAKIRTVAGQAVLFAEENSKRPLNVVRAFLKLRHGAEAAALWPGCGKPRTKISRSLLVRQVTILSTVPPNPESLTLTARLPQRHRQILALYRSRQCRSANWLSTMLAKRCDTDDLHGKTFSAAQPRSAPLPNLVTSDKGADGHIEMGYRAAGKNIEMAIRSKKMEFASRLPANFTPEIGCRILEISLPTC